MRPIFGWLSGGTLVVTLFLSGCGGGNKPDEVATAPPAQPVPPPQPLVAPPAQPMPVVPPAAEVVAPSVTDPLVVDPNQPVPPPPVTEPQPTPTPDPLASNPVPPPVPGIPDPNQPAIPVGPKSLGEFATLAMQMGREQEALQLIYAEAALGDEAGGKRAAEMRWVTPLKKPTLALRWGLGVIYDGTRAIAHPHAIPGKDGANFANSAPPPQPVAQPRTSKTRKDPNQQPKPPNFVAPTNPKQSLAFFTGDIGDRVLAGIRARMEKGNYGAFLQQSAKLAPHPGQDPNLNPLQNLAANLPQIPGVDPQAMAAAMGALGVGQSAGDVAVGNVMPGVVMLGESKLKDLLDQGRRQQVELAIVFEIQIRTFGDVVQNTTKMTLYDVAKGEVLQGTKSFLNTRIVKDRETTKGVDPVDQEVERLLAAADSKFAMTELPAAVTAERVAAHVEKQSASKPANPLAFLAELQFYHGQKLLTDEQRDQACEAVVGKDVIEKVKGSKPEELLGVLGTLLPGAKAADAPPAKAAP